MNNISNITFNDTQTSRNFSQLAFIKLMIVILARAGFVLIQSGSIPTEQFYDLLLHNIVEFSISSATYGLMGSILSFGSETFNGVIAYGTYSTLSMDYVVYGYCTIIIGSAIITTCLSGRLHFLAYTSIAFLYSGVTQPLLLHWIYNPNGWMGQISILNRTATLHDFGGGLTLNLTSGLISLIGLSFLGRRLLKLHNIDEYSIGSEAPVTVTLGYMLVIVGYIANCTLVTPMDTGGKFLVLNVILAVAGGGIAPIIVELFVKKLTFNFWLITRLLQGSLIGLTFTAPIIDLIYPPVAFGASLLGGSVISFSSKLLFKLVIQDYCNILTIFFLPGIWSPIVQVIIIAIGTPVLLPGDILYNFIWHTWCSLAILSFIAAIYGFLFFLLWCCGFLRNECERICHIRCMNLLRYTKQCPLHHLIDVTDEDDILEPGISGKTPNEAVHSHQQDTNLRHFRVRCPENKKLVSQRIPSILSQNDSGGTAKILWSSNTPYTFENPIAPVSSGHPLSSGDKASSTKILTVDKMIKSDRKTESTNKVRKKRSHHKLARSQRFTDFKRRRKLKKMWRSKSETYFKGFENEYAHAEFDAKYNDGFVTIKLPTAEPCISSE